jgi:DNA polymerase I-like protein with 3'-5' exonuclease and polymerase domains
MRIYNTGALTQNSGLSADETSWIYNGLDCCVTYEVRDKLRADLAAEPLNVQETYETAMRKLAPVLYMNIRGLKVNQGARKYAIDRYRHDLLFLESRFNQIMNEVFGWTINWRSPVQLKQFFYSTLGLKPVRKRNSRGEMAPTVNAEALERFQVYLYPSVFANYILTMRETGKKISFLETDIDDDGYMRTSLNIAGTDTGRFSSRFSAFGTGSNLQNVEDRMRRVLIPDDGKVFVEVDLEQADARNVGALIYSIFYNEDSRAADYLDACESGDLHTRVCSMAWKKLDWPDPWDPVLARQIADQIVYREDTYRDLSKKLGHGTNYYGLPPTMAMHTKTEVYIINEFQRAYFNAFPLIGNFDKDLSRNDWHGWVYRQLRDVGSLTTPFGRRRTFFDRYKDPATLRKAIAHSPQSMTGEELDRGWLNLWDNMREAELKMPVHDSILFQLPFEGLHELLPRALKLLPVEIILPGGRKFSVPLEAKVGWNWGKATKDKKTGLWENEYGLQKWTGREDRLPPPKRVGIKQFLGR